MRTVRVASVVWFLVQQLELLASIHSTYLFGVSIPCSAPHHFSLLRRAERAEFGPVFATINAATKSLWAARRAAAPSFLTTTLLRGQRGQGRFYRALVPASAPSGSNTVSSAQLPVLDKIRSATMSSGNASTSAAVSASSSSAATAPLAPTTAGTGTIPSAPAARSKLDSIPKLLYGTAWKGEYTSDLVILALTHGFRGIDTAGQRKHYREDHVGQALHTAQSEMNLDRREVWVQTKFTPRSGQDWNHPELIPFGHDEPVEVQVRKSFAASLRNLHPWLEFEPLDKVASKIQANHNAGGSVEDGDSGVEYGDKNGEAYIDSYVLHSPLTTLERTLKVWATMECFVQLGLVREIGISNVYDPDIFQAVARTTRIPPRIVQNRWHYTTGHDVALLSLLSPVLSPNDYSNGKAPGVVYQPFWSLTGNPNLLSSVEVQDLAIRNGWTAQQVVYAFLASGMNIPGLNVTVLSGTTNEDHMAQAVSAVQAAANPNTWRPGDLDRIRTRVYGE